MNTKNNLVSILLSIYNVEKYLEECLDSILAQSYENLEIVCVDNGSPDGCGKILEKYAQKDKRIKVVTLSENKKLCGGRNAGLDNATGDYICFVDPDDWIEKDHIKAMVEAIENIKDPDGNPLNLVVNYNAVNYMITPDQDIEKIFIFDTTHGIKTPKDYNSYVRLESDIPMWGRLYRKSFLDQWNVRFLDGFQTDNIPYTFKLMAHLKYWYCIKGEENATYWRRLITPAGAITVDVLYKNLEIPDTFDNLYDYLVEHKAERKIRIPFHLLFTICYHRHIDQPRLYEKYKALMHKMEDIIKTSGIYTQDDIDLCNLLLYTNGVFDFNNKYFAPRALLQGNRYEKEYIFFHIFKFLHILKHGDKTKYYVFGIPVLKTKYKDQKTRYYLFGFIPFMKIGMKLK
mgnify:CR=1 FL=1